MKCEFILDTQEGTVKLKLSPENDLEKQLTKLTFGDCNIKVDVHPKEDIVTLTSIQKKK